METVLACVGHFLLWTFCLYWVHRLAHIYRIPLITRMHWDHHKQVTQQTIKGLHWTNLFLWTDSWRSTVDLWCTDVIPTIIFCAVTGQWWIAVFYYVWAAFVQEAVEHNPKIDLYPFLSTGRWHLMHHENSGVNFGLFLPIWDWVFGTAKTRHE